MQYIAKTELVGMLYLLHVTVYTYRKVNIVLYTDRRDGITYSLYVKQTNRQTDGRSDY